MPLWRKSNMRISELILTDLLLTICILSGTVKIGGVSVVPGLNIEASRLLSSLLRYSKDPAVSDVMIEAGAVPLLVGLLISPHSQLINEMLVALNLLTAVRPPSPVLVENIEPDFLAGKMLEVLRMEEAKCPKEVKYNAISLVNSLLQWRIPGLSEHFSQPQLREELGKFDLEIVQQMMELLSPQSSGKEMISTAASFRMMFTYFRSPDS